MQTITLNIQSDSLFDKIMWLLSHFKNDGMEIVAVEDIEDLKLISVAKQESGQNIPLDDILKEYGVAN